MYRLALSRIRLAILADTSRVWEWEELLALFAEELYNASNDLFIEKLTDLGQDTMQQEYMDMVEQERRRGTI